MLVPEHGGEGGFRMQPSLFVGPVYKMLRFEGSIKLRHSLLFPFLSRMSGFAFTSQASSAVISVRCSIRLAKATYIVSAMIRATASNKGSTKMAIKLFGFSICPFKAESVLFTILLASVYL
jgi:hypothetical protein